MVKYVDRCHCDHRMTTQGRITSLKGRPDPKRFAFEIQSELRWFATRICQQDPEGLFWMSFYHRCTQQEVMLPTSKVRRGGEKKKSKFPADLWPSTQRGCHACIQRRFKQSLWLHYLSSSSSPLHPSVDTRSHHAKADRPGITHSFAS